MRPLSRIGLATAGAVVLAGGLVAGAAFAQSPSGDGQTSSWLSKFAQALGKSESEVQAAARTASNQLVDEAVAAGRITAEQAQRLKERIEQMPFSGPGPFGGPRGHGPGPFKGMGAPAIFRHDLDDLAQYLGLQPEALHEQIRSGKSLAQIAQEQGKSRDDLKSYITNEARTRLQQAVSEGKLTQEQADQQLSRLSSMIDQLIDRSIPAGAPHEGMPRRGESPRQPSA